MTWIARELARERRRIAFYDAGVLVGQGQPCKSGWNPKTTGCIPHPKAGKRTQVAAARASVAQDVLGAAGVARGARLDPAKRAELKSSIRDTAKVGRSQADAILDEHEGRAPSAGERAKRAAANTIDWAKEAVHWDHLVHGLEKEGWSPTAAKIITGVTALAKSAPVGPISLLVGGPGTAAGLLAYTLGATMVTNMASVYLGAKYGKRAANAAVALVKKRAGGGRAQSTS